MDLFGEGSIFSYLNENKGASVIAILFIITTSLALIGRYRKLGIYALVSKALIKCSLILSKIVHRKELKYKRDYEIGKLRDKSKKVVTYRFLNNLVIDLGLKREGVTPYGFLLVVMLASLGVALAVSKILFESIFIVILTFPVTVMVIFCFLYTKANIAHDKRIESIIEAQNIICSNIREGVVVAVKNTIHVMPKDVRNEFEQFIDNVEHKNYHIKTALEELNLNLGSVTDDFIKKCIVFELEEEHGMVDMFRDVIEINNIKSEMRIEMKLKFEEVIRDFAISVLLTMAFLIGVMVIFPNVGNFYTNKVIGQIILIADALIIVAEYVYITYLKAKEL